MQRPDTRNEPNETRRADDWTFPPIADYGLIGNGHSAGLVSRAGSIDWLCMPRIDAASSFGRILDAGAGGYFSIQPAGEHETTRRYLDRTLVLETVMTTPSGSVRILDAMVMPDDSRRGEQTLIRVVECREGSVDLDVRFVPSLEYGRVRPWIQRTGAGSFAVVGGNTGLVVSSDFGFVPEGRHALAARLSVAAGERRRSWLTWRRPEQAADLGPEKPGADEIDAALAGTISAWRGWTALLSAGDETARVLTSAMVLRALANPTTGSIAAAPTTSLPETIGGSRNWDYRYSWVRDSTFSVRALAELGFEEAAAAFRVFVERSAAGDPTQLQVMYGLGGEVRLHEVEIELQGYQGSRPVRIGNDAFRQLQLDTYGYVADLAWRWAQRGHTPDDFYWEFLCSLGDLVCRRWTAPDRGIWEVRGAPRHYVHSKAMCWTALDRLIRLADHLDQPCGSQWLGTRDQIRAAIERDGFDGQRGTYVRAFGSGDLDAALLLLPKFGYVDADDERMIGTVDAICRELDRDGHIMRYLADDGLEGQEATFVPCTFWAADVLAKQGRFELARRYLGAAATAANDLGLYSEEFDARSGVALGNFPLALSHMAHIAAELAMAGREETNR